MLYTLLVGKPPFDTDAVKSTLTRVVMADYIMPSHLSDNAKDLIDRLLKKNPKDRIRLRDIIKHSFITSLDKQRQNVRICLLSLLSIYKVKVIFLLHVKYKYIFTSL
jgi:serine/threonine protein kinase